MTKTALELWIECKADWADADITYDSAGRKGYVYNKSEFKTKTLAITESPEIARFIVQSTKILPEIKALMEENERLRNQVAWLSASPTERLAAKMTQLYESKNVNKTPNS